MTDRATGRLVDEEDGYARVYDEDDKIRVRKGDVRALLDVATMSMDFGSGFLDDEQVEVLRKIAVVLGIDPLVVTPHNFVCKYIGQHEWSEQSGYWMSPAHERQMVDGRRIAEEQTAQYAEVTDALAAAKAAVRADRSAENIAALEVAKADTIKLREEIRASRPTSWVPMDDADAPKWERCWRCGTQREIREVTTDGT